MIYSYVRYVATALPIVTNKSIGPSNKIRLLSDTEIAFIETFKIWCWQSKKGDC